jgi:uroporphyrin-3 C-methyltransferase
MADHTDKPTSSTPAGSAKASPASTAPQVESPKTALPSSAASASKVAGNHKKASTVGQINGKPVKTGLLWSMVVLNFILLIGVVAGGYWGWLQWQQLQSNQTQYIQGQQTKLDQQAQSQQSKLDQQARSNLAMADNVTQQNLTLQTDLQQLVEQMQNTTEQAQLAAQQSKANQQIITSIAGRRPADWLLAEADFLIRMAGRKLWLEHDVKTAVLMLQSADSRLQDLDDPSLLPIRERLAQDVQNLQQINPISLSSVALALGALLQQVDTLPLVTFERPDKVVDNTDVSDSANDWRSNLARNWQAFTKDFFSFRKKQSDVQPYMSEQQQWLAKEQIRLALLQAQSAVMKEDVTLYQQAMQNTLRVLIEDFDTQSTPVSQFTLSLQNLIDTDIERVYPGQFTVAPALQDLIQQRMDHVFSNGDAQP